MTVRPDHGPVVLIGPPGAGKSTVGAGLAARLQREHVDVDAVAGPSYAEVGWSVDRLAGRIADVGYEQAHREWEVALVHAVERLLAIHPDAVVSLGAGHTHPTRPDLVARLRRALAGARAVVLLRPHPDPTRAVAILRERCVESKGRDWIRDGVDWLERWSTDGCDDAVATVVVHTGDEPPGRTVDRVAALLRD